MNKKIKTEWDLTLFYKSEKDPRIEKEIKAMQKAVLAFEKKYRNKDYTSTSQKLFLALKDYEKLIEISSSSKVLRYLSLRSDLNSEDNVARALSTKIDNRLTILGNRITFFTLNISKIPKSKQKLFLNDKKLKHYKYFLKCIFDDAKYVLTEKEEQLASLLTNTSYSMWVDGQEKLLGSQVIDFKGDKFPLAKAMSMIHELAKRDRDELHREINLRLKSISYFSEAEINAVYNYKKVMDEKRGFKNPYSSTVLSYHNTEKSIASLVELVTKNFHISKRFYKTHAKLLKQEKLSLADRGVKIGEINREFSFEESVSLLGNIFNAVGKKYSDIFYRLVNNGQVDVFPKRGKQGGAYCAGTHDAPTMILLNHNDDLRSVETFAHEMGHAIHTELSKSQPLLYEDYPISSAEVASTFFEQVFLNEVESHLSEKEKVILLHNKLMNDMSSVFRQVAFFNFELELHQRIREEGQLSKERIALLLNKHFSSYMGDVFDIKEDDGYFYTAVSHFRRFFYVYSYSYGQLISRSFFENWKRDDKFINKVDFFLSAGGSMSPEDTFRKIGININDSKFFEDGLKSIEKDIEKLERLTKNL